MFKVGWNTNEERKSEYLKSAEEATLYPGTERVASSWSS
jgi:hypothetical protein